MADPDKVHWLKRRYINAPPTKKIKFSIIFDELVSQYPPTKFNSLAVSKIIKEAFPNTESKPAGKADLRYVFGLQEQEQMQCSNQWQSQRTLVFTNCAVTSRYVSILYS